MNKTTEKLFRKAADRLIAQGCRSSDGKGTNLIAIRSIGMDKVNTELFRKMADHLVAQGEKSWENGFCMYRHPAGLKCAVGALISDEFYDRVFDEGNHAFDFREIINAIAASQGLKSGQINESLIVEVQQLHDKGCPDDWLIELASYAETNYIDWRLAA